MIPSFVTNSQSRAFDDFTNDSEIIIGVYATSHPYLIKQKEENYLDMLKYYDLHFQVKMIIKFKEHQTICAVRAKLQNHIK